MGFIKNNKPEIGDLLRVKRKYGYYHFGIMIENDNVIHFSGATNDNCLNSNKVNIRVSSLIDFLKGDTLEINVPYDSIFTREEVVKRAKSLLNLDGKNKYKYNLITNNCEHIARQIYYNKHSSKQVNKVTTLTLTALGAIAGVLTTSIVMKKKK